MITTKPVVVVILLLRLLRLLLLRPLRLRLRCQRSEYTPSC